jgi:hypothetical protein
MDSTDRLNDKVEHAQCAECERDQRHRWLEAAGADGRRLDDPGDFVRLEIEGALTRGVRVIPVLVDAPRMPRPDQLPACLTPLARRQAIELSHAGFSANLASLLNVLDKELRPAPAREPPSGGALPAQGRPAGKAPAVPRDAAAVLPAPVTCFRDDPQMVPRMVPPSTWKGGQPAIIASIRRRE